ncbi:MAG TPA: universal stress protein [Polyangiaceae bacterium]|jgi:nucleotide-binding universal stress UspA family protein
MKPRRWIVVGTDFSPASGPALLRAAALASELGAAVACTHAYEDAPGASPQSDPTDALLVRLEEVAATVRARFPNITVECFVRRGAPWEKLANVACELGADMIVVGTSGVHSRSNPRFVGSVVTRIAATSNRSILVVPDQDATVLAAPL